jgi:hypothetical protein
MFSGWLHSHLPTLAAVSAVGLAAGALALAVPLPAAEVADALVVLEATTPYLPGQNWSAAPLRFVLLQDGEVFVGGSKDLLAGRLEKPEIKALEAQIDTVRKLPGLASVTAFGGDEPAFRLRVSKGKPLDLRVTGDPGKAAAALRPLAALLEQLLRFDHPSLRPYAPSSLALVAREASRPGGCRLWTLATAPAEATNGTTIAGSGASSWLPGVAPTSVCVGDKRYELQLRPLVPGERP